MADQNHTACGTRGAAVVTQVSRSFGGWLLAAVLCASAHAQTAPAPATAPRCELGSYKGPAPGRRGHLYERYIWAVTPEFARQYCMPEHTISTELTGAAAVAFRMVEGADTDGCRVTDDGKSACNVDTTGRYEIYLPQSLNLPSANPEVRFFDLRRNTSEWMFSHTERNTRGQRYRDGKYQLPPGQIPRFTRAYPVQDFGYQFLSRYEYKGSLEWSAGGYIERGFIADVMQGLDLLILESPGVARSLAFEDDNFRRARLDPASPDGRYVLLLVKSGEPDERAVHTIRLPHAFGQQVRALGRGPTGAQLTLQQVLEQLQPLTGK
jgi:hypothetical protein